MTVGCTFDGPAEVPNPQSVPAMTFSRPTKVAYWTLRPAPTFNEIAGGVDDSGNQYLAVWQFHVLPNFPFVGMARIGCLNGVGASVDLQHQVNNIL